MLPKRGFYRSGQAVVTLFFVSKSQQRFKVVDLARRFML
jgi:hypothetical protein